MAGTDKKLFINNIDLEITERCSLRCKNCFNCMQYYNRPRDLSLETIKWEIGTLFSIVGRINEIRILGGEPFMHKGLGEVVRFLHELHANLFGHIVIYTNSTILPNQDQLDIFSGSNTKFFISDYGIKKQRISEFCELLEQWEIEYEVHKLAYWYNPGSIQNNHKTNDELKKIYDGCWGRDCITLLDGKLFQCEIVANANRLKLIPDFPDDYVDLRQDKQIVDKMDYFLNKMEYMDSCRYCNLTHDKVVPGVQK